jgi:membrane protease YdiL (CAAX protease family)
MTTISTSMERYSLPAFLIFTPLISIAIALFLPVPAEIGAMAMAFVPTVMVILFTGLTGGRKSVTALLQKLLQWKIGFKWYVFALGLPLGIHLAMSLLALWLGWIPAIQVRPWSLPQFIIVAIFMVIAAPLEEIGWRGYALPGLLAHRPALFAALLIGVFWGALHLPLNAPGMVNAGAPWLATMLLFLGFSIVLTWLFIQTGGNLIIVTLCHICMNYFGIFNEGISAAGNAWLAAIVTFVIALILTLICGLNLNRSPVIDPAILEAV